MKIEGAGSVKGPKVEAPKAQKPFELEPSGNISKVVKGAHKEKVHLSGWAELAGDILEAAKSAPDVRHELVAEIKAKIESGEYEIDHEAVVERIIQDNLEFLKSAK